jgi:cytochrome c biogenesis protein CcmG, thiol:disulfide interchange protein DsbE
MSDLMARRRAFATRAGALLAILALAGSPRCATPSPTSMLHKSAPEFVRDDIHGQRVDLASFRGRVVLLTFWATWCAPCQIEMPHFVQWQQDRGPQGFQVIAISMDDDAAPVLSLTRKRNVNYPVIMGDGQLAALYGGILGLPVTFLIDRHGEIAAVFKGETRVKRIHAELLKLLN